MSRSVGSVGSFGGVSTPSILTILGLILSLRGGSAYFLISRSLGVSYGGAIGLIMFAAQAISVGFYCVGFAERVTNLMPQAPAGVGAPIAAVVAGALLIVAYMGADLGMREPRIIDVSKTEHLRAVRPEGRSGSLLYVLLATQKRDSRVRLSSL